MRATAAKQYALLSAGSAPAACGGSSRHCQVPRLSGGFAAAKHNTASEHGGLSAVVGSDFGLARVDEDAGLAGTLPAGLLDLTGLRRCGRCARRRGLGGGEGEAGRARVGRARAAARLLGDTGHGRCGASGHGELRQDGRHPCRRADLVGEEIKNSLLLLAVLLEHLLGKGLARRLLRAEHGLAEGRVRRSWVRRVRVRAAQTRR